MGCLSLIAVAIACIIIGASGGLLVFSLMAAASAESRRREYEEYIKGVHADEQTSKG